MKGLIYSEPADLLETGERSKGNKPGINTTTEFTELFTVPTKYASTNMT